MRKIQSHGLVVGTVEEPRLVIDCSNSMIQETQKIRNKRSVSSTREHFTLHIEKVIMPQKGEGANVWVQKEMFSYELKDIGSYPRFLSQSSLSPSPFRSFFQFVPSGPAGALSLTVLNLSSRSMQALVSGKCLYMNRLAHGAFLSAPVWAGNVEVVLHHRVWSSIEERQICFTGNQETSDQLAALWRR